MVPSTANVLDLTDTVLRETATSGWRGQHPIQTIADHHIEGKGKGTVKSSKPTRGHRVLSPHYSPAGRVADHMLRSVEVIDPKLRKVLELRAEGYSCDEIGKRMKMSRNKASNMIRTSLAVGKMFLLVR